MKYKFIFLLSFLFLTCFSCKRNLDDTTRVRINIETYIAGKNQPTHPSIVSFEKPWNGWKYWMTYTPYPFANGEEENPCVSVSNDLMKWEVPDGLTNPIATNEETECDELKDPHILFRKDVNRLEIWYLGRLSKRLGGDGQQLTLFRKCSLDGINWSKYEVMTSTNYLSPTIIWENDHYSMWSIGFNLYNTAGTFVYQTSKDGKLWSNPQYCNINGDDNKLEIWHGGISKFKELYHFVYISSPNNSQDIFYCTSKDGINFHNKDVIKHNDEGWDRFYRPYLFFDNNRTYLFYGVITDNNAWYISQSQGETPFTLKAMTMGDYLNTVSPNSYEPVVTKGLRTYLSLLRNSLRIELLIIIPLMILLMRKITLKKEYRFYIISFIVFFYYYVLFGLSFNLDFLSIYFSALIIIMTIYSTTILIANYKS